MSIDKYIKKVKQTGLYTSLSGKLHPGSFLYLWILLPVYIMVRETLIALSRPAEQRLYIILRLFYVPLYTGTFVTLGKLSVAAALIVLIVNFKKSSERLKKPWVILFALLLLWGGVCTLFSDFPLSAWNGSYDRCNGYKSYFFFASVFLFAYFTDRTENKLKVLRFFTYMGTLMSVLMLAQIADVPFISQIFIYKASAVLFNSNHLGYLLTMTVLTSMGLYLFTSDPVQLILTGFQFFTLCKNNTFGSFLGVWAAVPFAYLVYIMSGRRPSLKSFYPVFALALVSFTCSDIVIKNFKTLGSDVKEIKNKTKKSGSAGSGRMSLWRVAVKRIKMRPLLGWGPEGFQFSFPDDYQHKPHNEYLEYCAFLGFPGLLLYVSSLVTILVNRLKNITAVDTAVLISGIAVFGYLVQAFFGNVVFYTSPYFFMLIGFAAGELKQIK